MITPATEEKIKRDAEAKYPLRAALFTGGKIPDDNFIGGSHAFLHGGREVEAGEMEYMSVIEAEAREKAWAEMCEELERALEKCSRANERRPEDFKGGPEFVLSRIDVQEFSKQALSKLRAFREAR